MVTITGCIAAKPGQPAESARNVLGFRDGSANPDSADAQLMDRVVWVGPKSGEPAWAVGGSYQAVTKAAGAKPYR